MSIIEDHKKALIVSGNISDFQLKNLKNYPFIAFGKIVESVEVSYNFKHLGAEQVHPGSIIYNFKIKNGIRVKKEDLKNGIIHLKWLTKILFFNDTDVIITRNGKKWAI